MTAPSFLNLHHVHSIPVMTEHVHTVLAGRTVPGLSRVKVGRAPLRHLDFTRLELFFNLALTTVTSDNWHELNLEMVGLMYCMGRHLEVKPGLVVSTASRSGPRSSEVRLADYLKSGFAGQLGAGVAALYARDLGALYLAHVEDVDHLPVAQLMRVYQRRVPPKKRAPAPPSPTPLSTRKGDFLTFNAQDGFGMLEAKATTVSGKSQAFMTREVLDGAQWQVDPFVAGAIQTGITRSGVASSTAVIQHGAVSGLEIHRSTGGAAIHAIRLTMPPGHPATTPSSASMLAKPHFQAWWRLFNLAFANLTLPPREVHLPVMTLGAMSFVVNLDSSPSGFKFVPGSQIRQEGWAAALVPGYWNPDAPVLMGIEKGIFRQLLAALTGRRAIQEERIDGDSRFRQVRQANIDATGAPEDLHAAVIRFQTQLREQTDLRPEDDPTGRRQLQVWRSILAEQLGGNLATGVFREGVIAFAGLPEGTLLTTQRLRIQAAVEPERTS